MPTRRYISYRDRTVDDMQKSAAKLNRFINYLHITLSRFFGRQNHFSFWLLDWIVQHWFHHLYTEYRICVRHLLRPVTTETCPDTRCGGIQTLLCLVNVLNTTIKHSYNTSPTFKVLEILTFQFSR
ncbi:unnamed protein product [Chrysodeixis includens]|uniref:Uncharacterized protein n=1 Tax=Chrysodeixis includens TaxID=689277 RepID=A0A9N8KUK0_CHRIL|nr:unnamed protein product [Chrysodeixis includens]